MSMQNADVVFIGNGIVSSVAAVKIKSSHPEKKIVVVGDFTRPFSASIAAGAMHAVFCEIEETFYTNQRDQDIFNASLESRSMWRTFLREYGLESAITAKSTIMYRRKHGTQFEEANFEAACEVASNHNCLESVAKHTLDSIFCGKLKHSDLVAKEFQNEFAIDAAELFKNLDILMNRMGIILVDDHATEIEPLAEGVQIRLRKLDEIRAFKVVLAAGTESQKLLPVDFPKVPVYHAVGTAFVMNSAPNTYGDLGMVVRSPNRGGAQCGMHVVPRNGGKYYLGAGNYLSKSTPAHRLETIRYLIDICENELFGKNTIYNVKAELLLGSRPKSIDGYPVVGTYTKNHNIFIATGMYRIGLTIAPLVADEISLWYKGREPSVHFKMCSPERVLHSYAPMEVAARYYSESRVSNLMEHGLLDSTDSNAIAQKKLELETAAKSSNLGIVSMYKFPSNFVVDPDLYSMLLTNGD